MLSEEELPDLFFGLLVYVASFNVAFYKNGRLLASAGQEARVVLKSVDGNFLDLLNQVVLKILNICQLRRLHH